MGENVQCPVCTLYLHAGMNLSDHLETHPKEQVIKALVQMTISGTGGGLWGLTSALKGENSDSVTDIKKTASEYQKENAQSVEKQSDIHESSITSSTSNCSLSNQSTVSSSRSSNILSNFSNSHVTESSTSETERRDSVSTVILNKSQRSEELLCVGGKDKKTSKDCTTNDRYGNVHRTFLNTTPTVETSNGNNFSMFGTQRCNIQQQQRNPQHQINVPSHMPPPPTPGHQQDVSRVVLSAPQQNIPTQVTPTGSATFHALQSHQLQHAPLSHNSTHFSNIVNNQGRHTQAFNAGQQQHTSSQVLHNNQDLKVIYSSGLPPPPPLQVFTYQPTSQLQHHHQKPPPAYGTAISQIRSQHNHNKNQIALHHIAQHQPPTQHVIFQQNNQQQQGTNHTQHERMHHSNANSITPISGKQLVSKTNDPQKSHTLFTLGPSESVRQGQLSSQLQYKYFIAQQQQLQENSALASELQTTDSTNCIDTPNKTLKTVTTTGSTFHHAQVSISPSIASASMTAVTASTLSRHTNSPFAALFAAATGAPSPSSSSSVLKYAESPVAHYLERDNGDFIVQETPKHIVECVEKDNGEFSVIERIYQSPPSVLHIHDDDENDQRADGYEDSHNETSTTKGCDNEDSKDCSISKSQKKKKISPSSTKEDANHHSRSANKLSGKSKDTNNKYNDFGVSTRGKQIVDFVNISSDSEEEEFISHEPKALKMSTHKIKKTDSSPSTSCATLPSTTVHTQSQSSLMASSYPLSSPELYSGPSTSQPKSSSNANVHQNGTRKKSSKNTITVLSDVQLNLNEYLDLVGNIIASSKVATQRRTFTSIAPIPLVKIEKEEPFDEYLVPTEIAKPSSEQTSSLKTNKQETTHNTNSIHKSQNISINDQKNIENNDKKPEVLENIKKDYGMENTIASLNSSQVTSVIRMATTSQHIQQQSLPPSTVSEIHQLTEGKYEAEDLSQNVRKQTQCKSIGHSMLIRKVPKKLVIKQKSIRPELISAQHSLFDDQQPSTSSKLQKEQNTIEIKGCDDIEMLNEQEVQVKNEPITSIAFENTQYQHSFGILEQQLTCKEPILVCKEEKPCIQEAMLPSAMKVEKNVNEDARVLYDFARSKKSSAEKNKVSSFPSVNSLFTNTLKMASSSTGPQTSYEHLNAVHPQIETTSYSSQSALDASLPLKQTGKNSVIDTTTSIGHSQNSQTFVDFTFNCLYNGNNSLTEHMEKNPQHSDSPYRNDTGNENTNIKNEKILEKFSTSNKHFSDVNNPHAEPGFSQHQWFSSYHQTPVTTNTTSSNVNTSLSAEYSAVEDGPDIGKYIDLDACKRERSAAIPSSDCGRLTFTPPPSSSTSCTLTGAAENSMPCISSGAASLNIRTDEKMPAKGEISEQESNCDIDNSWSQPMYGDISTRYFKTTFPGIFPQENGWNHEEYFTVQDLSTSTIYQTTTETSSKTKSFEFRTEGHSTLEGESSGLSIFSPNSSENGNIDALPSTSAKVKKRKKYSIQNIKTSAQPTKRPLPTCTITSQDMLQPQNLVEGLEFTFPHQQQPSTSAEYMAGSSNAAVSTGQPSTSLQVTQQRTRMKVYECGHCNTKYSKLKDRNAHMVEIHNYVRQNRRLVCLTSGVDVRMAEAHSLVPISTTFAPQATDTESGMGELKQEIVKIETDNIQQDIPGFESISADLSAKKEIIEDVKQNLSLVAISLETSNCIDTKPPNFQPISLTTPMSKLTNLYKMLVTFNMTTLKQSQRLTECDENIIKSSIFFCYECRQNFNSVKLYDVHLTEHPAECFTCGKKFQRWKNFSLHLKRHLGWKEFGCTVCDKKFVVRSALIEHMRMHSGLSPLKCKVCGKHFKRYSNLTQHRKRHSPKQLVRRKEFVCYCGEVLPSKARFLWHKETHDSKPKCCPHCCDRFVHVNSLRRHIRLAHSDKFNYAEPMECAICKQIFAKASMKAHMATHSTETQFDCVICSKSFSTKWNLKIHSWVHANRTAKPFKCEHCPKAFVREVDFKNHINSHKQIKPYTCEVCGCKFIRKYNYMRHRREHHGNKKYTCDLCKKSFHRHYYLIEHRRIHTGERPFQCTICGKSSTTKTNHNKHLKIHHSRDPFTAEV